MKNIPSYLLISFMYYLGYQKDITLFQVLSWIIISLSTFVIVLGFVGLNMINTNDEVGKLKAKFPSSIEFMIGLIFLVLNSVIFYGHDIYYAYIFASSLSYLFLFRVYQKLKTHNHIQ